MEDNVILLVILNNTILRKVILTENYEGYIFSTETAENLLLSCKRYVKEDMTKALTQAELDTIFSSDFREESDELVLWNDVKNLDIPDISFIEPAVIKQIKIKIKDYFLAEAFEEDNYDRAKLDKLYDTLSKLSNLDSDEENIIEDLDLSSEDACVETYASRREEGIKFFDERISDTLTSKCFDYGTLNVLTAPPGSGKTMIILNQGVYVASQKKHSLHLAIGDLTKRQLLIRLLAIITSKPMQQISMLNPTQFRKFIQKAKEKYPDVFSYLHCKCIIPNAMNGVELIKFVEKEQLRLDIHFDQVVVDYDGNIETSLTSNRAIHSGNQQSKTMYFENADVYNNLVSFAKRNRSVVWVLSQPKISYWKDDRVPLEGLSDSSRKQHIVDFIMSAGKKIKDEPQVTLFISKNRNGESNLVFYSEMDGSTQQLKPITSWQDND